MVRIQTSILLAAICVAGCASPSDYPSLAKRDAERVTGAFQPAPREYVPPPAPTEALSRLDSLRAQAADAHGRFVAEAPGVQPAVAAGNGAEEGSDAWSRAQVALAGLQGTRAPAVIALAELDQIYARVLTDTAEIARIAAVREEVLAMVESEDQLIAQLSAEITR